WADAPRFERRTYPWWTAGPSAGPGPCTGSVPRSSRSSYPRRFPILLYDHAETVATSERRWGAAPRMRFTGRGSMRTYPEAAGSKTDGAGRARFAGRRGATIVSAARLDLLDIAMAARLTTGRARRQDGPVHGQSLAPAGPFATAHHEKLRGIPRN